MPASLAQSCEIDMKHVMSFVARSNMTSITVYSRSTDMITLDNVLLAQISVEKGKKCFQVSNGHKYSVMTLSSIRFISCFPQEERAKCQMCNLAPSSDQLKNGTTNLD